ncbi:MAG TPA: hypothetical protein VNR88_07180 [Hyphomicrobium sp.]|nr:hypothetical protein [Hyphomicrobium sp.]
MNRAIMIGICAAAGVMMQASFVTPASAAYLGYGNGDPGDWDLQTEQAGGPCGLPGQQALDASTGQPKCCSKYNPMSACPLAGAFETPTHGYRSAHRHLHRS